jgi:hypothetical protein
VSQRSIEIVVGRLVTDEAFREAFLRDPQQTLKMLVESGMALTDLEIQALLGTHRALWSRMAEELDPRLQKASLGRSA